MLPSTKALVRGRAGNACEYCHLHQNDSPLAVLHIEHIIPKTHGGRDDLDTWLWPASIVICTKART
jgi:hypothetical protein